MVQDFLLHYEIYSLSSGELLLLRPFLEVEEARLSRITVCRATHYSSVNGYSLCTSSMLQVVHSTQS